jgi:predicted nucleic acid-binding protein
VLDAGFVTGVTPTKVPRIVPGDPDDDHVVAAAVKARVDLIISGDGHLLELETYRGIRILNPANALAIITS